MKVVFQEAGRTQDDHFELVELEQTHGAVDVCEEVSLCLGQHLAVRIRVGVGLGLGLALEVGLAAGFGHRTSLPCFFLGMRRSIRALFTYRFWTGLRLGLGLGFGLRFGLGFGFGFTVMAGVTTHT